MAESFSGEVSSPTDWMRIRNFRTSNSNVTRAWREANQAFEGGKLEQANLLFTAILAHPSLEDRLPEEMSIRMQIAAMDLYRGSYKDSKQCFLSIKRKLDDMETVYGKSSVAELQYRCQRWLANCRLLAGNWEEAITQINTLLSQNRNRPNTKLHRDISLAYAYLGRYNEAKKHLAQTTRNEQDSSERKWGYGPQTQNASSQVAIATVYMLAGNYPEALEYSSNALYLMKKTRGPFHMKTLAAAILKAWCLTYNGKHSSAGKLCLYAHQALDEKLGLLHPQTLEARSCLAYICLCQGQPADAFHWAAVLGKTSTKRWVVMRASDSHPQTISLKFLMAMALLGSGDYMKSKRAIDMVVDQAKHSMGANHPETLRYQSEQARIIFRLGNTRKAGELALHTAIQQSRLYCEPVQTHAHWGLSNLNDTLRRSSSIPHPFLLSTLELIANIELRKHLLPDHRYGVADLDGARELLTIVQESHSKMIPQNKVLTSSIDFNLAMFLLKTEVTSPKKVPTALKLLRKAYGSKKSHLGDDHFDTLCALRELMAAECKYGLSISETEFSMIRPTKKSRIVLETLKSRLGPFHPETLRSRLWYLIIGIVLDHGGGDIWNEMQQKLIEDLSNPQVVNERLVDSFDMKWELADILIGMGKLQEAAGIIDDSISKLGKLGRKELGELLKEPLSHLREDFIKLRQMIRGGGGEV